jgi:rod shape-determining protein MreC
VAAYQENFFTRGPSPLARVTFFGLIAVAVMIADHRFQALGMVRVGVATVLTPIEQALNWPASVARDLGAYFTKQSQLLAENKTLNEQVLALAAEGQRARLMSAEQTQISALLSSSQRFQREGVIAEIIRDARNPFARKIIINRGYADGIKAGAAVIDGSGVVGQVTAIGASSAEVTLTTEKDQSVPVLVVRASVVTPAKTATVETSSAMAANPLVTATATFPTIPAPTIAEAKRTPEPKGGLRAVAVGSGREGTIELPFIPVAADVQVGDDLVTSGIDGTYPAGLLVGTVRLVDKNPAFSFARIVVQPATAPDHHRFVKVLLAESKQAAYPAVDAGVEEKSGQARSAPSKREAKIEAKRALRER